MTGRNPRGLTANLTANGMDPGGFQATGWMTNRGIPKESERAASGEHRPVASREAAGGLNEVRINFWDMNLCDCKRRLGRAIEAGIDMCNVTRYT
jgi:hypothetical protein